MPRIRPFIGFSLLLAVNLLPARAQVSGGGPMTGGVYRVVGTLGQPAVGVAQEGIVQAQSGFWPAVRKVPMANPDTGTERGEPVAEELPDRFVLHANYPNPFNPTTTIRFDVPETTTARIEVYDALGRCLRTLREGTVTAGRYEVRWDARDAAGRAVASGLYLYRLTTPTYTQVRAMVLLR